MCRYVILIVTLCALTSSTGWQSVSWAQEHDSRPVVVLSPGHGWSTGSGDNVAPGAIVDDLVEKDVNLAVSQQAREFLDRCPVETHLTREGDDPKHTLENVDEIVNAWKPDVGVSIHANSLGTPKSGTEGWYTVDGDDDAGSKLLAEDLTSSISGRFAIPVFGVKPETDNRHGGLYIHHWDAPSALVELAELHEDAALLRDRQRDFGRSIAEGILAYLEIPASCADYARQQGAVIAVYFPGEERSVDVALQNDGIVEWQTGSYSLARATDSSDRRAALPLRQATPAGAVARWTLPFTAPSTPGVHREVWRIQRANDAVPGDLSVYAVVVPEGARELKEKLEQQIVEWREKGEEEVERMAEQLAQQLLEWLKTEAEERARTVCGAPLASAVVLMGIAWHRSRRRW